MTTDTRRKLLGAGELGLLLGVGRTRVKQLAALPSFPAPVERLMMGAVWELADVKRWASETGRTLSYQNLENADPDPLLPGGSSSGTAGTAVQREP